MAYFETVINSFLKSFKIFPISNKMKNTTNTTRNFDENFFL